MALRVACVPCCGARLVPRAGSPGISLAVSQLRLHADASGAKLGLRPLRDSLVGALTAKLSVAPEHALSQNFASPAGRPRGLWR